jgi:hypothetical protein
VVVAPIDHQHGGFDSSQEVDLVGFREGVLERKASPCEDRRLEPFLARQKRRCDNGTPAKPEVERQGFVERRDEKGYSIFPSVRLSAWTTPSATSVSMAGVSLSCRS